MNALLSLLFLGSLVAGSIRVIRPPTAPNLLPRDSTGDCLAIYEVTPEAQYTTQGNDKGMLPPHGIDTSGYTLIDVVNGQVRVVTGKNYLDEPFATNADIQSSAKAISSVTALTENTGTPIGFKKDSYMETYAICVNVLGVSGRWVEVMTSTLKPDQSMCVMDWQKVSVPGNPTEIACGSGHVIMCKDAAVEAGQADSVGFKFFCKDSCEATDTDFYWRIAVSHFKPVSNSTGQQPDGENWCGYRSGTDWPSTLLNPYPDTYVPPPVFDKLTASASSSLPSFALALLSTLFVIFFFL